MTARHGAERIPSPTRFGTSGVPLAAWDQRREGGTPWDHPNFRPAALKEQWPVCPSEAPPAARGHGRPPNTLPLVRFGRGSGGAAGISCHRLPSPPGQGTCRSSSRGTQRPTGTKQGPPEAAVPRGAGGPAPKGCWQLDAPPSAGHILLEKVPLRRLQVLAETRLKNVQNAVFASFPSGISQHVPQTGHFLTVWLWLSRSGIILIGKQDYKLARGQNLPVENTCTRRRSQSLVSAQGLG